ncbi:hypothetical protein BDN71DRAFT_1507644 [Pleurotus eryngii]|uniref:Uncharacterized protein n=1 Tax=Pleurotus eryngii TaxID=5323 RepID=A0A9P5ZV32_PLEER|nr:hypothetical protein BDN71DRAFT_1507644 [Pleurotus eryngii]
MATQHSRRGNQVLDSGVEGFKHRPSPPSDTAPSRGWEPIYMPQEQAPKAVAREENIDRETFSSRPNPEQPNPPSRGWEPVYKPSSDDKQQPIANREEPENPAVAKFLQRQRRMPVTNACSLVRLQKKILPIMPKTTNRQVCGLPSISLPASVSPEISNALLDVSGQQKQQANEGPEIDAFKQRPSEPTPNPPSRGWAPVYKPSGEHPVDM